MREKLKKLYVHLGKFELQDGINEIGIPYIKIYKGHNGEIILPILTEPFIYIIASGSISIHDADKIYSLSEGDFFIPNFYRPTFTTATENIIVIMASFCITDVVSILLEIDECFMLNNYENCNLVNKLIEYSNLFLDLLIKIFDYIHNIFMLNNIKREFIYHILNSPYGKIFIENTLGINNSLDMLNVNNWIKRNYKNCFSVEELAFQANMSLSNFHQKFKASIGMGPIQCQKQLRLVEARRLMLDQSANVTSAALEVGYESISQFISDYRRMFGRPPQKDIQKIRKCLINKASIKDFLK